MEKIPNVFLKVPDYNCFGCSPDNEQGLRLEFFAREDGVCVTEFVPSRTFSGFPGICHGGIAATVLDELAFWTVFHSLRRFALTAKMELKFRLPVPVDEKVTAEMKVKGKRGNIVMLEGVLKRGDGRAAVVGELAYYLVDAAGWRRATGSAVHESIEEYL